jgi:3-hydroxybutyryl-CoA dehydrogenase
MKAEEFKRVLIIGGGTMGQQISVPCVLSGLDVVLYDIKQEMLDKALVRIGRILDRFVEGMRVSREEADWAMKRITTETDPQKAGRDVDLVSESVPEDPELKGKVFAQFHGICPERAIFTTNTSTLLPSMFAAATGRPDRFCALHFHDVRVTNVVDIMPHPGTSPETVASVKAFTDRIAMLPIVMKKESPGYVFNKMISDLFKAAQTLAANGVASVEDVDRAWMGVTHMIVGPFGLMDGIGLDTVYHITHYWAKRMKDDQAMRNASFMKEYVDRGELGQKTQKGFYEYPNPAYGRPDFLTGLKAK